MELREKIKEILIKHYHFVDCDDVADELLNLHIVSQRTYFFDCWNVGGKTFTKEIKATCKEHAILKFEKEYDSFGYDEPYVG